MKRRPVNVIVLAAGLVACGPVLAGIGQGEGPRYARWMDANRFEGWYEGRVQLSSEPKAVMAQLHVTAVGQSAYRGTLRIDDEGRGGGVSKNNGTEFELHGTLRDFTLVLQGSGMRLQFIHGRFTALDDDNNYAGHLTRVFREATPQRGQPNGGE